MTPPLGEMKVLRNPKIRPIRAHVSEFAHRVDWRFESVGLVIYCLNCPAVFPLLSLSMRTVMEEFDLFSPGGVPELVATLNKPVPTVWDHILTDL